MASVQVFPTGFRLLDTDGNPVSGGKALFYEAGTTTPKVVYSDATLSTSLGSTVYTRSDGQFVASEGSSTTVLVYTGEDSYKLELRRSNDTVLFGPFDDIVGAPSLTSEAQETPFVPVITTGSNVTLDADDRGALYNVQSNTVTFPSAVTLGDGWNVHIRNGGSSGRVVLSAASGIAYQGTSYTTMYLEPGQAISVTCDGASYRAFGDAVLYTPAGFRPNTPGVIMIADRISSAPSTSVGSRYIVTGAYSTFSVGDIVEEVATGVFIGYTPPTDCGWVAYVQDEDTYYAFIGSAWAQVGINVDGLTEDTNPDSDDDFVATYDDSASGHKKIPLGMMPGSIIAIIEDQKTQNTAAQSLSGGVDNVRELTTLAYNRGSLVSLSSNRFTLPAGTWEVAWWAPVRNVLNAFGTSQSFLFNQTDSAEVARGTCTRWGENVSGGVDSTHMSVGSAVVTITASKAFEIRHRQDVSGPGGETGNFGTEVYTRVVVRRA